jgi:hypothetical protein
MCITNYMCYTAPDLQLDSKSECVSEFSVVIGLYSGILA